MALISIPSGHCRFGCRSRFCPSQHAICELNMTLDLTLHEQSRSEGSSKILRLEKNGSATGTGPRIDSSSDKKQTTEPLHGRHIGTALHHQDKGKFVSILLSALQKPLQAKPFPRTKCQICGENFSSREKLFKHLRAHSHAPNWTPSLLLAELQTVRDFVQNYSNEHQLDHARWCLQKLVTAVDRMKPHEARKMSRARADNGATILHFLVDLWAALSKKNWFTRTSRSFVTILKQLIAWAISSSEISPKFPVSHSKLPASSKTSWCGPWFTKCAGAQRRKYCGFQSEQRILQQAEMKKPLTDFFISEEKCWMHHDCKPGETALEVCTGLPFVRMDVK